jgi:hypothetical protein
MDESVDNKDDTDEAKGSDRVKGVKDEDILAEAKKRFAAAESAEGPNRTKFKAQMEFISGKQWDERLKQMRESEFRPCLTFDRLTTCVNQVVNNMRQNKPAIKIHPVSSDADVKVAEKYNGLTRHIERISSADVAYETAGWTQVAAGIGGWRILQRYQNDTAFDQELIIDREPDPLRYYFDPMARDPEASDMMWCFIATDVSKEQFKQDYPDTDPESWGNWSTAGGWWSEDSVRVAEYFRIVMKKTTIYRLADGTSCSQEEYESRLAKTDSLPRIVKERPGKRREVQWFKLGGSTVIDSRVMNGKWIPVVRVIGNEIVVDGKTEYTGMTWRAMDAMRAYNYHNSVAIETLAMQPKAPYIGAKGQFKGVEQRWRGANNQNPAYLEYEPVEINGNLAPAPQRQSPPTVPTGALQLMQTAGEDIKWVTGLQAPAFGANSSAKSGRAINAEQQAGDTATYHYVDNLSRSIRHTGRILVDLIPYVYDTKQTLRILGEDGEVDYATIDPEQPEAVKKVQQADGTIKEVFNLGVGSYDVEVAVGPSFSTKRLEAVDAMTALMDRAPGLIEKMGDIYFRNQDWPGAGEIADRLKKLLPPGLADEEEGSQEQKLQQLGQQADQMHQALTEIVPLYEQTKQESEALKATLQKLQQDLEAAKDSRDLDAYKAEAENAIKAFDAETKRITAVSAAMTPEQVQALVWQTLQDAMQMPPLEQSVEPEFQVEQLPEQLPPPMPEQQDLPVMQEQAQFPPSMPPQ